VIDPNHPAFDLDDRLIKRTATHASLLLSQMGFATVRLEPGDSTRYDISITRLFQLNEFEHGVREPVNGLPFHPHVERTEYWVSSSLTGMYPWHGDELGEHGYVMDKWCRYNNELTSEWTAVVLYRFLNHLSTELHVAAEGAP
jgi:hypothetical protein